MGAVDLRLRTTCQEICCARAGCDGCLYCNVPDVNSKVLVENLEVFEMADSKFSASSMISTQTVVLASVSTTK
jgi:hypothetical protein